MEPIWQWGIDFINVIQLASGPALTAFFKIITFMGEEEFFLILLPFFFWCVEFSEGVRLSVIFLLSTYVNASLKDLFAHPRPFVLNPALQLHEVSGYGLPSGHAQSSVVIWGVIAAGIRKTWGWLVAVSLMLLIGFSRIYLGVHFPTDVLGGWLIGAIILAIYVFWGRSVEAALKRADYPTQLILALILPLALLLLHVTEGTVSAMAVLMGMGLGVVILSRRHKSFRAAGPVWQRLVRFVVGMTGIAILYFGLKVVFPQEGEPLYIVMRVVRYAVVGLWVSLGAPQLFQRMNLASASDEEV